MGITKNYILKKAKEANVKFVRLQFTDILGIVKNVAIPVEQLEKALDNKIMFDGSSIEGFTRINESDMYLRPDYNTFTILPWRKEVPVARLICDIYMPDGSPFPGCPRGILKKVMARAAEMGYIPNAGPEAEFFLFKRDEAGRPTTETHDEGGYFDLSPVDKGENARRDMVLTLQEMGFEVEASHHEVAEGQHEIDFKYADALTTADRLSTFKIVTKTVASEHGLHATFMPKPIYGINGSGMHTHLSLFKEDEPVFFDESDPNGLSQMAKYFVGGVLAHISEITAVANPLVNSYKRLVPGYEAPVYIAWSMANRSALIRVPASRGVSTRVELRSPDPACNPYLAFALMFAAGLEGIENKIEPPTPLTKNIYQMTTEERAEAGIKSLPGSLGEALAELAESSLVRDVFGPHALGHFLKAKSLEWEVYNSSVHNWEIEQYLNIY